MNIVNNHRVCNGCKFSSFHYCDKFNQACLSARFYGQRYQLICIECYKNDSYTLGLKQNLHDDNNLLAYFRIPGLNILPEIKSLVKLREYYPEIFYKNHFITSIYGAFPGALWNGRQPNFENKTYSYEEIEVIKNDLEKLNLSLNLTWNNNLITQNDLSDKFCNIITEIFHTGKHAITVASNDLYLYLKNKYPNYQYYLSAIATDNKNLSNYNFNNGFNKYVINRRINNNWQELNKIKPQDRNKIEFICNDFCPPFCNRIYHYNLGNELLLDRKNPINPVRDYCAIDYDFINFNNNNWSTTIKPEDIQEYLKKGFQNFKLCSRGDATPILLLKILPYFIKPEYILDAFSWVYNHYELTENDARKLMEVRNYES